MLSTAASWLALLALAAALTRYYNPELFKKLTQKTLAVVEQQTETAPIPAAKRQKPKRTHTARVESNTGASTSTSANEGLANKRRKLVSPSVENDVAAKGVQSKPLESTQKEEIEMSNKDFAQQLAKAQAGTKLDAPASKGTSKKERRAVKKATQGDQSGQDKSGVFAETSSSSNGGRDADGDFSPVGSPASGPVSTAPTSRADDLSDMLEAPAAKPTTLRLTDIKEKVRSLPKTVSKAFEPVLSKKQRQRQAKQAEQKALKEESDKVHERKKQEQLRAARTATGTSNQTKADAFTAKQNAWQAGKPAAVKSEENPSDAQHAPLLDTFEREDAPAIKGNDAVSSAPLSKISNSLLATTNVNQVRQEKGDDKTSALAASGREKGSRPRIESQSSWADEVNDEEQSRWASQLTDEGSWESVTNKKGKKKTTKDNETSSEASSLVTRPTRESKKPITNGNKANGVKPKTEGVNRFASIQQPTDSSFQDAEWEA